MLPGLTPLCGGTVTPSGEIGSTGPISGFLSSQIVPLKIEANKKRAKNESFSEYASD